MIIDGGGDLWARRSAHAATSASVGGRRPSLFTHVQSVHGQFASAIISFYIQSIKPSIPFPIFVEVSLGDKLNIRTAQQTTTDEGKRPCAVIVTARLPISDLHVVHHFASKSLLKDRAVYVVFVRLCLYPCSYIHVCLNNFLKIPRLSRCWK